MHQISFDLETITPLFMSGTDIGKPELRPPSFKGMMRFWWRAMRAEDNISKLAQDEAEIFGGTGKGQGKSKLQIRITNVSELKITKNFRHEVETQNNKYSGLGYLLYSTYTLKDKGNPILRAFIVPGQKFSLILKSMDKEAMNQGLASLWLMLYFGGLGTRARRGGGNIEVKNIKQSELNDLNELFNPSQAELPYFIRNGFKWAKEKIETKPPTNKYSNLSNIRILIGPSFENWKKALNNIGEIYREYRMGIKRNLFEGPNYGIPVMHSGFKTRLVGYKDDELLSDRRSSPLIIKVIRFNGGYVPLVLKLYGNLLPNGSVVMKEDRSGKEWVSSGNFKNEDQGIIIKFLDEVLANDYTEIKL